MTSPSESSKWKNSWLQGVLTTIASAGLIWLAGAVFGMPEYIERIVDRKMKPHIESAADINDVTHLKDDLKQLNQTLREAIRLLNQTRESLAELKGEVRAVQSTLDHWR